MEVVRVRVRIRFRVRVRVHVEDCHTVRVRVRVRVRIRVGVRISVRVTCKEDRAERSSPFLPCLLFCLVYLSGLILSGHILSCKSKEQTPTSMEHVGFNAQCLFVEVCVLCHVACLCCVLSCIASRCALPDDGGYMVGVSVWIILDSMVLPLPGF